MYDYNYDNSPFVDPDLQKERFLARKPKVSRLTLAFFSASAFFMCLVSGILSSIPQLKELVYSQFFESHWVSNTAIALYVLAMVVFVYGLIASRFFSYRKIAVKSNVLAAIIFAVFVALSTSFLTTFCLCFTASRIFNAAQLAFIMLIPLGLFAIAGLVGYYAKEITIKWVYIVGSIATVSSFLVLIISMFTVFSNQKIVAFYLFLCLIALICTIIANFYGMSKAQEQLQKFPTSSVEEIYFALNYAFSLYLTFFYFVYLVTYFFGIIKL